MPMQNTPRLKETISVANNACWAIGELAIKVWDLLILQIDENRFVIPFFCTLLHELTPRWSFLFLGKKPCWLLNATFSSLIITDFLISGSSRNFSSCHDSDLVFGSNPSALRGNFSFCYWSLMACIPIKSQLCVFY